MSKILLIGKLGQLGWELRRALAPLGSLVCVDYPEFDLARHDAVRERIRELAPAIIINAAAYTAVDKAESEPALCMQINGIAPGILAEEAKKIGALLVHYSTDYVFDGAKNSPYTEDDTPNPLSAYGRSKLAGEQAVQQVDGDYLLFRLCWLYGARGHNFMLTIMRLAREREKLRVVSDQVGCPTWSRLAAETTALALQQVLAANQARSFKGLYHLCASGQTSWHAFAESILNLMPNQDKKCRQVEPISTPEYPLPAKRPAYSVLSCEKLKRVFGLSLPLWEESLKLVLDQAP